MLRLLFTAICLCAFTVNAQINYSYSFSGQIPDIELLSNHFLKIDGVSTCKIRYKAEKQAGEILFQLKPYEKTYDDKGNLINPSPLIQIKELFYRENLEPIELVEFKN